jgi:diacylglycerol O-acyltransferase
VTAVAETAERMVAEDAAGRSRALRPSVAGEIALGLVVFAFYSVVTGLDWAGREAAASRHAHDVMALERYLHIDLEPALNRGLAPHHALRVFANYEYATTYVISALALLIYLYRKRPDVYRPARTSFGILTVLAVCCFAVYPLMPPRLVPGTGFVDTVRIGHTVGSWGSPFVAHANQLAAMPSLHFGWALWVSVVLAKVSGGRRTQLVSALHVLLTLWVILATANHYLIDAIAAFVFIQVSVLLAGRWHRTSGRLIPSADAFFLHVETDAAPQHVGGVVLLDTTTRSGGAPSRQDVENLMRERFGPLRPFRQTLAPASRWRRARWRDTTDIDWTWHVPLVDLARPDGTSGGLPAFEALVARLAATRLPRDRPLWRMVVVHNIEPGVAGVVLLVHHVVADGIGTVGQALKILEPQLPEPADGTLGGPARPGPLQTALGTVVGLTQLATDGTAPSTLPSAGTAERRFALARVPFEDVRAIARTQGARVSDVLLTAVAGALRQVLLQGHHTPPETARASVPLMVRDPRDTAVGNVTAAVMLDLPLGDMGPAGEPQRLLAVARQSARLRTPTRALASRFVMTVAGEVLPPPLHGWFARTVYGPRYFSAIVSNMPGPPIQLSLCDAPLLAASPLLPLAPGVPLAVGTLGWNGTLCVGISADPGLLPDAAAFGEAMTAVFRALAAGAAEPAHSV